MCREEGWWLGALQDAVVDIRGKMGLGCVRVSIIRSLVNGYYFLLDYY